MRGLQAKNQSPSVLQKKESDQMGDEEHSYRTSTSNPTSKRQRIPPFEDELLDCPICFCPLTIPVHQCENGHTACSSCWRMSANKCHSCSLSAGSIRCLAVEKIVESDKVPCQNMKYGCTKTISYRKKCDHNNTCIYAPCSCPILGCNFISSSEKLRRHVRTEHYDEVIGFYYDEEFLLLSFADENIVVLLELDENVVFIASRNQEITGNKFTISCLEPLSTGGYWYELSAKNGRDNIAFQSYTKCIQSITDKPSSVGLLLPSSHSFVPDVYLHAVIRRKDV